MPRSTRVDLTGKVYGRLTVIAFRPDDTKNAHWLCRCRCGRETVVRASCLTTGYTKSCNCLAREASSVRNRKHGLRSRPEYEVWRLMVRRCHDPRSTSYRDYGARGISVCPRWRASIEAFISDMGPRPSKKHEIDRINNDRGYEPGNCRWTTRLIQSRNKRDTILVEYRGKVSPLSELARKSRVNYDTIRYRLRAGWSAEDALNKPPKGKEFKKATGKEPA